MGGKVKSLDAIGINKEKFKCLFLNKLVFLDSAAFLNGSLAASVDTLNKSNHDFKILRQWDGVKRERPWYAVSQSFAADYLGNIQMSPRIFKVCKDIERYVKKVTLEGKLGRFLPSSSPPFDSSEVTMVPPTCTCKKPSGTEEEEEEVKPPDEKDIWGMRDSYDTRTSPICLAPNRLIWGHRVKREMVSYSDMSHPVRDEKKSSEGWWNNVDEATTERRMKLLRQKGIFCYDFVTGGDLQLYRTKQLPPKEKFYNVLTQQECSDEDYERALTVWKE